jgi:hypothetical protein
MVNLKIYGRRQLLSVSTTCGAEKNNEISEHSTITQHQNQLLSELGLLQLEYSIRCSY